MGRNERLNVPGSLQASLPDKEWASCGLLGNHRGLAFKAVNCSQLRSQHAPHPDDARAGAGAVTPSVLSTLMGIAATSTPPQWAVTARLGPQPPDHIMRGLMSLLTWKLPWHSVLMAGKGPVLLPSFSLNAPSSLKEGVWCSAPRRMDKGRSILCSWVFPSEYCAKRPAFHTTSICPYLHSTVPWAEHLARQSP